MLTKELLQANEVLTSLTDEQVQAICTLSQNDENAVIGARFGEVYRQFDSIIANNTGIARNGDEKTYNYLERAAKELSAKASETDGLQKQVEALMKDKSKLEKAIADGTTDTEAKKALTQAQKDLASITKQYNELKTQYDNAEQKHAAQLLGVQVDAELQSALAGVKMRQDLPQAVTDVVVRQAIQKVKAMNPDYIDDGNGGKRLVFKGDNGEILRNQEQQLNPYTASELVSRELKALGIIDEGRQQNGIGTQPQKDTPATGSVSVSVAGAKTQSEAYDIIANSLMAAGYTNGSAEFQQRLTQAWKDNNVKALPK